MNELQKIFEDKLQTQNQYLTMDNIPQKIKAKLIKYDFKPDKRGNECLY